MNIKTNSNMVEEDYVSFETAKLLKEKGFDEPCESAYTKEGQYLLSCYNGIAGRRIKNSEALNFSYSVVSPTLQTAMKWLREEKNFFIEIQCYGCEANEKAHFEYSYVIEEFVKYEGECLTFGLEHIKGKSRFKSYEEACETAIKYCLKNLI